jgi:hypothetical protein
MQKHIKIITVLDFIQGALTIILGFLIITDKQLKFPIFPLVLIFGLGSFQVFVGTNMAELKRWTKIAQIAIGVLYIWVSILLMSPVAILINLILSGYYVCVMLKADAVVS